MKTIPNFLASICIPYWVLEFMCARERVSQVSSCCHVPNKSPKKKNPKKYTKNLLLFARCYRVKLYVPWAHVKANMREVIVLCRKARFYFERLLRFWNTWELGGGSQGFNNCAIFDHGLQRTYVKCPSLGTSRHLQHLISSPNEKIVAPQRGSHCFEKLEQNTWYS
jgi:hypothetical protein